MQRHRTERVPSSVDIWNKATLKSLVVPGSILFAAAALLLQGELIPLSTPAVNFYYYAVFGGGILLSLRFNSSRIFFALLVLFLGHHAIEFFASPGVHSGPGRIALESVALLLPLNFLLFAFVREHGLAIHSILPRIGLVFVESVFVAVICRPDETSAPALLHPAFVNQHWFSWTRIPQFSWFFFVVTCAVLLVRFAMRRNPVESGLLWSLAAAFFALQIGAVGAAPRAYVATAGLILFSSIIENSYVLAYHDELTTLPARRAFNDALLRLQTPYSIAVVDIDHFKNFNDSYGHDTGDQVLCMVAARLAQVTGGGQAYRIGGEEFSILFPGKTASESFDHLELLRKKIESSIFHVRRQQDRRAQPHGPDRRRAASKKASRTRTQPKNPSVQELSVTVSIGVAEASMSTRDPDPVIRSADKAVYRAKDSGRNRVEMATTSRARAAKRSA
jgi:diguanylate cyclase (GGDEF)-like protein